jgi:hypothetical protein
MAKSETRSASLKAFWSKPENKARVRAAQKAGWSKLKGAIRQRRLGVSHGQSKQSMAEWDAKFAKASEAAKAQADALMARPDCPRGIDPMYVWFWCLCRELGLDPTDPPLGQRASNITKA